MHGNGAYAEVLCYISAVLAMEIALSARKGYKEVMKKTVLVLFGGQSSEHEVSCKSAINVIRNVDPALFETVLIGITKAGEWLYVDSVEEIEKDTWRNSSKKAFMAPDAVEKSVVILDGEHCSKVKVDVAIPVLHGLYGEDGTVQGIFELAKLPYVGCGVFASSASMDKFYTKVVVDRAGIRQAAYEPVFKDELSDMDAVTARIEGRFSYPVFIKPANEGSSCGITKAENREMLVSGLRVAAEHDRKILVEETIVGREIECAVFGGGKDPVVAFGVGEVQAAADYYDYDAKYNNPDSKTVVGPTLPGNAAEEVMESAVKIFRAVDGYGLARVDFFVCEDGTVVFNELNTLPGFTAISMYPMIAEAAGYDKKALISKLIDSAMKRYER
ncbi:D-alanine--D-alanine ligase [[Clostridium] aminophilum]|uniref:D-alanine--D-alanine ligase n=2 Tax=[Clostridium] aminophilum TaxID=1526 RepID=A0A1I0CW82_9FIRM|nr:D-alanine--D-alanine ligase [[Clostridium] aminophilum]